jgi:hypothetical protein
MKIEKIESSDTLEPGQLLIASDSWRWFASDAFLVSRRRPRELEFYRHRRGPVPGVHRSKRQQIFSHPRTTNERRATPSNRTSKEYLEVHGAVFKLRGKRAFNALPTLYDDICIRHQRSWKKYRLVQRKRLDEINHQIHSPPFWVPHLDKCLGWCHQKILPSILNRECSACEGRR